MDDEETPLSSPSLHPHHLVIIQGNSKRDRSYKKCKLYILKP